MARNSGPAARNLLSAHGVGAGKGDKPRHKFSQEWRDNYDAIDWSGSCTQFYRSGRKLIRKYQGGK